MASFLLQRNLDAPRERRQDDLVGLDSSEVAQIAEGLGITDEEVLTGRDYSFAVAAPLCKAGCQ
jgi:hypothetical protein